jgi:hypothetical protein
MAVVPTVNPPDPPHPEPVPETTPEEFTCKHCVEPVILENVGAEANVCVPVNV